MNGQIFDIKRFAVHDGPGIRTTVFFKGCPLRCIWCHNPEGMCLGRDLMVKRERCILCETCVSACKDNALSVQNNQIVIDRRQCTFCNACVDACPTRAIVRIDRDVTDDELVEELTCDLIFTGDEGGVTLSGGDPLFQADFALSVLKKLKERHVNTCVESCLMTPSHVIESLMEVTDHFLVDIKLIDSDAHRRFTGAGNEQILQNIALLSTGNADMSIRVPLIPGITATDENLTGIARFVKSLNRDLPIELLNFNSLALSKYNLIDQIYFDESLRALPEAAFARLHQLVDDERRRCP